MSEATLTITRTENGFVEGERAIDERFVSALLSTLDAPVVPELEPERLRPLIGDVDAEALRLLPKAPLVAKRLTALIADRKIFGDIVRLAYAQEVSDDYPSLAVELSWAGGQHRTIKSSSQHPLMLPWSVDGGAPTWNPDISTAIAALLPEKFMNRARVEGKHLGGSVVWMVRASHKKEMDAAEVAERFGGHLEPLNARFRVEGGTLDPFANFNVHPGNVWCGEVFFRDGEKIGFELCLSTGTEFHSVQPFLRDADTLLQKVRRLTWLQRYLAATPDARVFISYFDDRSLSERALKVLHYALERVGKLELEERLAGELPSSVGLHLWDDNQSHTWYVLPDGRSLLLEENIFVEPEKLTVGSLINLEGEVVQ